MRRVLRINGMSSSTRRARDVCPRLETRLDAGPQGNHHPKIHGRLDTLLDF